MPSSLARTAVLQGEYTVPVWTAPYRVPLALPGEQIWLLPQTDAPIVSQGVTYSDTDYDAILGFQLSRLSPLSAVTSLVGTVSPGSTSPYFVAYPPLAYVKNHVSTSALTPSANLSCLRLNINLSVSSSVPVSGTGSQTYTGGLAVSPPWIIGDVGWQGNAYTLAFLDWAIDNKAYLFNGSTFSTAANFYPGVTTGSNGFYLVWRDDVAASNFLLGHDAVASTPTITVASQIDGSGTIYDISFDNPAVNVNLANNVTAQPAGFVVPSNTVPGQFVCLSHDGSKYWLFNFEPQDAGAATILGNGAGWLATYTQAWLGNDGVFFIVSGNNAADLGAVACNVSSVTVQQSPSVRIAVANYCCTPNGGGTR
jgi:hypothetical protein